MGLPRQGLLGVSGSTVLLLSTFWWSSPVLAADEVTTTTILASTTTTIASTTTTTEPEISTTTTTTASTTTSTDIALTDTPEPPDPEEIADGIDPNAVDGVSGSLGPDPTDEAVSNAFDTYQASAIAEAIEQRIVRYFPIAGFNAYSDSWGAPRDGGRRRHKGADIFAPKLTPVVAVASGTVIAASPGQGTAGVYVKIKHENGAVTAYLHLNNDTPGTDDGQVVGIARGIEKGAFVRGGAIIGYVGDSGNAEGTPPHLHFEYRPNGVDAVDPYPLLQSVTAPLRAGANPMRVTAAVDTLPFTGPISPALLMLAIFSTALGCGFLFSSRGIPQLSDDTTDRVVDTA